MTQRNTKQPEPIETLEARQHLAAAVNVTTFEPFALRQERQPGIFVVTRRDNLQSDLTVNLTVRGTATNGVDYGRIGPQVTIPAGQRSVAIPVRPVNNSLESEYVTLTVDLPPGYRTASQTAVVYVVTNRVSPVPQVRASDFYVGDRNPTANGLFPFTPGAGGAVSRPVGSPPPPSTPSDNDSVVGDANGGITTIPTGSNVNVGGVNRPGTVTTVTVDIVTGLPIMVTENLGGNGIPTNLGGTGTIAQGIFGNTPIILG